MNQLPTELMSTVVTAHQIELQEQAAQQGSSGNSLRQIVGRSVIHLGEMISGIKPAPATSTGKRLVLS